VKIRIPYSTILTQNQIEEVHETSLRILEDVGVSSNSQTILKIFKQAGANIDHESKRIKITRKMVEDALKTAPRKVTLYGRDPQKDMILEEGEVHFGFGGTGVNNIIDLETGKIRTPTKKDVEDGSRLGDALNSISFVMVLASANDCPPEVHYLHELQAKYENTTKPVMHAVPGTTYARRALEMAEVVAGGSDEFKKRPMIASYSEPVAPLFYSADTENIIEFAKVKAPVILAPAPTMCATGPGTVIGTFSLGNAESLFGVVLSQIVNPGAPVVIGNHTGVIDMQTTRIRYAAIEWVMGRVMTAQMARFYGIPSSGLGACSDAKTPDAQAGVETTLTILISAQGGVNMMQCDGTMAGGTLGSFELAVINDEIIGTVERFLKGVTVDRETLAFDVVKEIGPEGQFLSHDHTLSHFRNELYFPKLFDRQSEEAWLKQGGKTTFEKAREKAKEIISHHQVIPLSASQQTALSKIIKEAETQFANVKR